MKYTEVIPAMQKNASGSPFSAFLKLLSRMVYGTDFDEDEREGRKMVGEAMGKAVGDMADTMIDASNAVPELKQDTEAQTGASDTYTKFKEQHNSNN